MEQPLSAAARAELLNGLPALLLPWYDTNKRDLPWRENRDPYRVLVSELMLQQTRVEAVREHYVRFLRELPDVQALAACPEDKLFKLWEGLGYYSRARNLQRAAQAICEHGFPQTAEGLKKLPGVGSTRRARSLPSPLNSPRPRWTATSCASSRGIWATRAPRRSCARRSPLSLRPRTPRAGAATSRRA